MKVWKYYRQNLLTASDMKALIMQHNAPCQVHNIINNSHYWNIITNVSSISFVAWRKWKYSREWMFFTFHSHSAEYAPKTFYRQLSTGTPSAGAKCAALSYWVVMGWPWHIKCPGQDHGACNKWWAQKMRYHYIALGDLQQHCGTVC